MRIIEWASSAKVFLIQTNVSLSLSGASVWALLESPIRLGVCGPTHVLARELYSKNPTPLGAVQAT